MYNLDAIETINFEQIATATDRLLLHRGRVPKHRPSQRTLARPVAAPAPEHTMIVRTRRRGFDGTTILVSSVVSGAFFAFAAIAALV